MWGKPFLNVNENLPSHTQPKGNYCCCLEHHHLWNCNALCPLSERSRFPVSPLCLPSNSCDPLINTFTRKSVINYIAPFKPVTYSIYHTSDMQTQWTEEAEKRRPQRQMMLDWKITYGYRKPKEEAQEQEQWQCWTSDLRDREAAVKSTEVMS